MPITSRQCRAWPGAASVANPVNAHSRMRAPPRRSIPRIASRVAATAARLSAIRADWSIAITRGDPSEFDDPQERVRVPPAVAGFGVDAAPERRERVARPSCGEVAAAVDAEAVGCPLNSFGDRIYVADRLKALHAHARHFEQRARGGARHEDRRATPPRRQHTVAFGVWHRAVEAVLAAGFQRFDRGKCNLCRQRISAALIGGHGDLQEIGGRTYFSQCDVAESSLMELRCSGVNGLKTCLS